MTSGEFEFGVRLFGEHLLKLSVSHAHEGEVSYQEIVEVAKAFGVVLKADFNQEENQV
jgi:hypothetical protein